MSTSDRDRRAGVVSRSHGGVDDATGDLLDLLSNDWTPWSNTEWGIFTEALTHAADTDGTLSPNKMRRLIRGNIAPSRVGSFYRRAALEGLIRFTGRFVASDDAESRNTGKPCRVYELVR